jgi:predicted RNase H-like nuclease
MQESFPGSGRVIGTVLGVDGCRGGWVGVVLGPDPAAPPRGVYGTTIAEVVAQAAEGAEGAPLAAIGIDMPVHLGDAWPRAGDLAARAHLGRKASSLFVTPPAAAYAAASYAEACAVSRELTGGWAPSRQAWALAPKIAEVAAWASQAPCRVHEVHPEVSFSLMAGAPLLARKFSWAGHGARRAALAGQGIVVPDDLGPAGRAGADDVLDAAAVAWTARRLAAGAAVSFPDPPVPSAVWA